MIIKTYQSYIIKTYIGFLSRITLIFFGLILILNVFEEISYFKDIDVNGFYPILMSTLNSTSLLYAVFPFIFLVSTQFFFLKIEEKNELLLLKHSGLTNFNLIKLISIVSFFLGILIISFFYHFSSKLKHLHLDIKNQFSNDNKYLAVVTENGIWMKDEIDNVVSLINADIIKKNKLINVSITQFTKDFEFIQNIKTNEINIKNYDWKIEEAEISKDKVETIIKKKLVLKTNFNMEKINNLFSNLSSLSLWELNKLKKDYKSLGYSTLEVDTHTLKIYSYPLYLMIMTVFSSIIMINIKKDKPKIFNLILGILLSVVIYYITYFSNLLGENEKLPIFLAVWMPQIILILLSLIGLIKINEK
jgi:lipopolysaccharide export system permease protein